jgi:ribonuclease III
VSGSTPVETTRQDAVEAVQAAVGYTFNDSMLLRLALTHASIADSRLGSNERMEFLGDSVLGLIISRRIYDRYPSLLEGEMTKIKSTAVSRQTCAMVARQLGLDQHLITGKGMQTHAQTPQSLAAAVLESVIAAIYLDGGYSAAQAFVLPLIDPLIEQAASSGHQENFKSVLQQHVQQQFGDTPTYRILDEKGPDHSKCFKICVDIAGKRYGACWGQSKKQAEQQAALGALREMGLVEDQADGSIRIITPPPSAAAPAPPASSNGQVHGGAE